MSNLDELFNSFNNQHILVLGDLMIDAYLIGKVDRISPEAPVPVVSVNKRDHRLGGAANVALNLKALGTKVSLAGVVGNDENGKRFKELLEENQILDEGVMIDSSRPTTIKTRVMSGHQQILRVDEETTNDIDDSIQERLFNTICSTIDSGLSAIIFEDYNKGVLTAELIERVINYASSKGVLTCVDPKNNHFFDYKGVDLFKPNLKELREGLKINIDQVNRETILSASNQLKSILSNEITLITLSENGVFIDRGNEDLLIPAHHRDIADVSGAGDTVISVACCCLVSGVTIKQIASISNLAGGLVCEQSGVIPIDKALLLSEAKKLNL